MSNFIDTAEVSDGRFVIWALKFGLDDVRCFKFHQAALNFSKTFSITFALAFPGFPRFPYQGQRNISTLQHAVHYKVIKVFLVVFTVVL